MPQRDALSRRTILRISLYAALLAGCKPVAEATSTATSTVRPSPLPTARLTSTWTPHPIETLPLTPRTGPLVSDSSIVQVAAGGLISLALRTDGRAWAWGDAYVLGLPPERVAPYGVEYVVTPTLLESLDQIEAISAARTFALFIRNGQLLTLNFNETSELSFLEDMDQIVQALGAGRSILVRRADGTVWGFGENDQGQLGNGETQQADRFVKVAIDSVINLAVFGSAFVALREDGTLWWWGNSFVFGSDEYSLTPQQLPHFQQVADIASGDGLAVVYPDGTVSILWWDGSVKPMPVPRGIRRAIGTNDGYGYLLANDGTLWGWGDAWERLGIGPTPFPDGEHGDILSEAERLTPKQVVLSNVVDASVGSLHSIALDSEGTVWTWGSGALGNGNDPDEFEPAPIPIIYSS